MNHTKTTAARLSVAALALGCCMMAVAGAHAAVDGPSAGGSDARPTSDGKGAEKLSPADLNPPQSEMRLMIERYVADRGSLSRFYTAETSPVRYARMKQFYGEWLSTIGEIKFDDMSLDGKIDYLLFKNYLGHELRQLDLRAKAFAEAAQLVPFAEAITGLEDARRRLERVDAEKVAALLTRLGRQVEETRKAVEAGLDNQAKGESRGAAIKAKKTVANRAAVILNGLRATLKNWFGFHNGYDPVFTWWVGEPYKAVDQALGNYSAFLREKVVGVKSTDETAIIGDPIGREALVSELAYEMIPYTPEELIALANKELAWCDAEMRRASRELGYGDDWRKALEYVKTLHVEPGRQPELIKELALEAIAFVDQHDLVTVPQLARDTWRMEMMTPEQQLVSPFFLGGESILVSYPTNTMGHEQKMMSMRGNNIHFSRATVFHELIPGHHLQGFMAGRYRIHRSLFSTPFWTEGWALYWEMLLWDMNFAKSPENRIGMLFWRMHRCARIIFSLSFHLEKMTPQECIDLLVTRVGHEADNATAEVRRSFAGNYGPLYQCAYLLGGLQIRALRGQLVDSGKMTNRAFHDAILKENRIPIEMVRASLTGQKLTRDFSSGWKFYAGLK
ncbi:MAG TPA: DUF885 family protein [Blastocatellia bacterium]|nr:DUF885 family protein [Blastocatellia bacterium]